VSCLGDARWREAIFSVGSHEFQWLDAFLGAILRGDWDGFEQELLGGLVCAADESTEWPPDDEVDRAATAFRYERNLLTTDEIEGWLERAGLSTEVWTEHLMRRVLRERADDGLAEQIAAAGDALEITSEAFAAEGLCSGWFDRFRTELAGRAAVAQTRASEPLTQSRVDRVVRLMERKTRWFEGVHQSELAERLGRLAEVEARYAIELRHVVTPQALAAELTRHRLEWVRVDLERLSFASEEAAREAALCVHEDGQTLADIAATSHASLVDTRAVIEQLPRELHDAVLSAAVDDLIGPIAVGDRYEVALVAGKASADLADPIVRTRAEAAVIEQLVSRATRTHVKWPRPAAE